MLDLDAMCARAFSVRLGNRSLQVRAPSVRAVRRLLALSDKPDDELLEQQGRLAAEILSDNREGEIVTRETLDALPPGAVQAILTEAMRAAMAVASDPD